MFHKRWVSISSPSLIMHRTHLPYVCIQMTTWNYTSTFRLLRTLWAFLSRLTRQFEQRISISMPPVQMNVTISSATNWFWASRNGTILHSNSPQLPPLNRAQTPTSREDFGKAHGGRCEESRLFGRSKPWMDF